MHYICITYTEIYVALLLLGNYKSKYITYARFVSIGG